MAPVSEWVGKTIDWRSIAALWRELGYADPADDVQTCLISTWKEGTRNSYGSHLRRIAFFHWSAPAGDTQSLAESILLLLFRSGYRPATLRGAVSALHAVWVMGWIPPLRWERLWRLAGAPVATPGDRPYAGPHVLQVMAEACQTRRTGLSSPPPSSPSAASPAWGKSRLSGAPACRGRRWLSGASNGTRAEFPVTSAVLRANEPTGCGASFLDGTSWSTEPPSSKRVSPDCSKAALTRLTAGTRGVARGLPSSDSVASPGATYAGGDAGPVCAWRTSTQRHQRTSPSTRGHACRGQRVRGSSGSPPTQPSSGRHRSWVSACRTRGPLSSRPPDRSATEVPRQWWKGTTPGTLCSRRPPSDPHDPRCLASLRGNKDSRPPRVRRWLPRSPHRPQDAAQIRPPRPENPLLEVRRGGGVAPDSSTTAQAPESGSSVGASGSPQRQSVAAKFRGRARDHQRAAPVVRGGGGGSGLLRLRSRGRGLGAPVELPPGTAMAGSRVRRLKGASRGHGSRQVPDPIIIDEG